MIVKVGLPSAVESVSTTAIISAQRRYLSRRSSFFGHWQAIDTYRIPALDRTFSIDVQFLARISNRDRDHAISCYISVCPEISSKCFHDCLAVILVVNRSKTWPMPSQKWLDTDTLRCGSSSARCSTTTHSSPQHRAAGSPRPAASEAH